MSRRLFTQQEIASLLANKHVVRCSEKSITYDPAFKLAAVQRYQDGLSPSAIFREAGFDLVLIGRKTSKWLVTDWRKKFHEHGAEGLEKDGRGSHAKGRPRGLVGMSEKEKLQYLAAQVAYLKAENAFLARLRKQRLNYGHVRSFTSSNPSKAMSRSCAPSPTYRGAGTTGGSNRLARLTKTMMITCLSKRFLTKERRNTAGEPFK